MTGPEDNPADEQFERERMIDEIKRLSQTCEAWQGAGCPVCGVTRFILAQPHDPFAVDRHTGQGTFRMVCEHCAMTRERDRWREEAEQLQEIVTDIAKGQDPVKCLVEGLATVAALTKTNIQLLSKVQETQSHLEQQQQATYQAELERDGWRLTVSKS